jgi:uncharacterized protein YjdB
VIRDSIPQGETLLTVKSGDALPAISFAEDNWFDFKFGGLSVLSENILDGTLNWVSNVVATTDDFGNIAAEGYYRAKAVFTPDAKYGQAYTPVYVYIPVEISASDTAVASLNNALYGIGGTPQNPKSGSVIAILNTVKAVAAYENYASTDVAALEQAADALIALLDSGDNIPPKAINPILDNLRIKVTAIQHDHHVIAEKSNLETITAKGQAAAVAYKGVFESLSYLTLSVSGKSDATLSLVATADATVKNLRLKGVNIGTVEKDSAGVSIMRLDASYLDELENGVYTYKPVFTDNYKQGSGSASLTINRVSEPPNPPSILVESVVISGLADGAVFKYKASGKGNTVQFTAVASPVTADNKAIVWSSNNNKVATVDADGLATFIGPEGDVVISATTTDGSAKVATVTVKVVKNVTKIRVPFTAVNLTVKKNISVAPVLNDGSKVITAGLTYKSSNVKIATVDSKGKVKGIKKGKATITITALNGKKATVKVTVAKKAVKLKKFTIKGVKKNALSLKNGKTKDLKIVLAQKTATNLKVSFKSGKPSVLKVDKAGRITAVKKGKATVTVKVGGRTVKVIVTVKK